MLRMPNCPTDTGVSPSETRNATPNTLAIDLRLGLPSAATWPNARRAIILSRQEVLDRELASMPRREWFDAALRAHLVDDQARALRDVETP